MANKVIADNVTTVYAIKRVGADQFRHCDPVNGEWWGPLKGAFTFGSVEEAIKYGAYFVGREPFQVYPVETREKR